MIGKLYTVTVGNETHSAVPNTLIEIASDAIVPTFVERLWVGQSTFDTSENLNIHVQRVTTTGTADTPTPEPLSIGDVYQGVVKTNHTIEPTYTGSTEVLIQGFNVLSGFLWTPASDDEVILVTAADLLGMKLADNAPSTAMFFSYGVTLREIN